VISPPARKSVLDGHPPPGTTSQVALDEIPRLAKAPTCAEPWAVARAEPLPLFFTRSGVEGLDHLAANGYPLDPADVARLTPLGHPTINLDGRYRTTSRPPTTGLRPLRTDLPRILYRSSSQAVLRQGSLFAERVAASAGPGLRRFARCRRPARCRAGGAGRAGDRAHGAPAGSPR
jgi:hypothetical protein